MSKQLYDTAYSILALGGTMPTMRMQALVYHTYVEWLQQTGEFLFPEQFQAWTVGPVVWELFRLHRGMWVINVDDLQKQHPQMRLLKECQLKIARKIVADYGKLTLQELHDRFNMPGTPWKTARYGLKSYEPATEANIITKRMLRAYYLN